MVTPSIQCSFAEKYAKTETYGIEHRYTTSGGGGGGVVLNSSNLGLCEKSAHARIIVTLCQPTCKPQHYEGATANQPARGTSVYLN